MGKNNLVKDYLNGLDVPDIDKLENDIDFMKQVIKLSHDKNMLRFVGDKVIEETEFVDFLIDEFSDDDPEFIIDYVTKYCSEGKKQDIYDYFFESIIIKMVKLTNNQMNIFSILLHEMILFQYIDMKIGKKELGNDFSYGEGFIYILEQFEHTHVTAFYAEHLLNSLMVDERDGLENFLHENFLNATEVTDKAIFKKIIEFSGEYDMNLQAYLIANPNIVKNYLKDYQIYLNRWDYYYDNLMLKKIDYLEEEIEKFLEESNSSMNYIDVCCDSQILANVPDDLTCNGERIAIDYQSLPLNEQLLYIKLKKYSNWLFNPKNVKLFTIDEFDQTTGRNGKKVRIRKDNIISFK